jgi:hypothetical protein
MESFITITITTIIGDLLVLATAVINLAAACARTVAPESRHRREVPPPQPPRHPAQK